PPTTPPPAAPAAPPIPAASQSLSQVERQTIEIFERSAPAVTFITTLAVRQDLFRWKATTVPQGTGSGIVWDRRGHVVTNYHVIQDADAARVTLSDRSVWTAKLVGAYAAKDIAVLKIDAPRKQLRPLARGTSHNLRVGQHVLAIGNPFGLDQTLSTGVISGLQREIMSVNRRPIQGVIQTDAAINPGNSGGPLIDTSGRLIGINTSIYSPTGAYAGIGFAVPVNTVQRIVSQLIEHGRVVRPGLGLHIDEAGLAGRLGLPGVLVLDVPRGSPAARAGIKPLRRDRFTGGILLGHTIVAIDDTRITSATDLFRALDRKRIGDRARVGFLYDGRRTTVELPLVPVADE
ncbi:MAG: trypsin-like peptidase domain-containing protein, partial [Myxococcales bacterium]|nr:trypsin-like peptidase domain-containing protein [Myxococcales bacterium]